jgi:hypothetical protein
MPPVNPNVDWGADQKVPPRGKRLGEDPLAIRLHRLPETDNQFCPQGHFLRDLSQKNGVETHYSEGELSDSAAASGGWSSATHDTNSRSQFSADSAI